LNCRFYADFNAATRNKFPLTRIESDRRGSTTHEDARSERRIANDTDPLHAKRSNSAIETSLLHCVEAIRALLHMQRDSAVTIAAAAEDLKERTIEKPRVFSAQCLPASVDLSERNG
jgi:hypothetical protein